jgi:diguanylate cyclase (GGDEF)-like protein/PAS domain S-box-containing protein
MVDLIGNFFSSDGFMPHGHCYLWRPDLLWLHVISDAFIVLAYYSIPVALVHFVRKRKDLEFNWMFICFAVFILACGTTHVMEIWNIWTPTYWLSGAIKALTALASVPTAILLVKLVPIALRIPSPSDLRVVNEQMRCEIHERKQIERRLLSTEEKLSGILDSIGNVVWSASESELLYINSIAEKIYGRPIEQFFQNKNLLYDVVHPDDKRRVLDGNEKLHKENTLTQEYRIVRPDGTVRWLDERSKVVRDATGRMLRIDGVGIDVTERKEHQARIEYLAAHDALTNLANRNLLGDRVSQAMLHAHRTERLLVLLFLDLDRFKDVNDSLGHHVGDLLLKSVAARLQKVIREADTVARQGGDEFIILLPDLQELSDVVNAVTKVIKAFSEPFAIEGHELYVTASIGATVYPNDGNDMPSLLRNADTAMYRAKEDGGNVFRFYSRDMSARALEQAELEKALRQAIDCQEFELFYQPKMDIITEQIIGAEALIRWRHADIGMIDPTRFIPIAEKIGLIMPIGNWALKTACAQNKAWQRAGLPMINIAVNLSARQFMQESLVDSVAEALRETGLDAKYLELELTESMVMNSADHFITKLQELKAMNVQLSIDDFGTGYSSLCYLKRFPLDRLKIDQSFIRDIATNPDDAAITRSIIALGRSLNLKVIAEGVETEEQLTFLRANRCDEVQGYYFSKPLSASDFFKFVTYHAKEATISA